MPKALRASFAEKLKRYLCLKEFKGLSPLVSFTLKLSFVFHQEAENKRPKGLTSLGSLWKKPFDL